MSRRRWGSPAVLFAVLSGCGEQPQDPPKPAPAVAATVPGVELTDVTFAGLDAAVKEQRGKVVVLDVWATW